MSILNNNIWTLAEAYVSGSMNDTDKFALLEELRTDNEFSAEFNECVNLIRSLAGSGEQKRFRNTLKEVSEAYTANNTTKIIPLRTNYWRVAAIAAGIALLTSFGTYWSINRPDKKSFSEYNVLRHELENIKRSQNQLIANINTKDKNSTPPAQVRYTGSGFALSNDGYFVTNYHVVEGADSIYIQNHDEKYFKASVAAFDRGNDIAILKVDNKYFRFGKTEVPYTLADTKAGLGTRVFTLGYPEEDIVYTEGYISSLTGFEQDSMQYRLQLPADPGLSGAPVLDDKGNILAIVTAKGNHNEGNTYAVSSSALLDLIGSLPGEVKVKLPKTNKLHSLSRDQQIQKLEYYTCSVKVYKK